MTFVFFIYGLSFFVLGLSILVYPKKGSAFKLATHLYLVAGFGLIHGMNEWADMFILIGAPPGDAGSTSLLAASRMLLLPGSFLFLLRFGTKVITESKKKYSWLKALPTVLPAIWLVIFATSEDRFTMGDRGSRCCASHKYGRKASGVHILCSDSKCDRLSRRQQNGAPYYKL